MQPLECKSLSVPQSVVGEADTLLLNRGCCSGLSATKNVDKSLYATCWVGLHNSMAAQMCAAQASL